MVFNLCLAALLRIVLKEFHFVHSQHESQLLFHTRQEFFTI